MDQAKSAVSDFMSKSGHHDTTVEQRAAPAITQEQVKPSRHEEATTAIDREVHQDHYHTTVQPMAHQEVMPEKHHHNLIPVQHKEFSHHNQEDTDRKLGETAAQFRDTSMTHDTKHTTSAAPVVEGERVHHHIHETIQPVIHKETITPEVVHTTVPVHETHHAAAQHHGTSVLPMKQMSEISSTGGILADGKPRHDQYDGCPKPFEEERKMETTDADRDFHSHGLTGATGRSMDTTSGPHSSNVANKVDPTVDSDRDGSNRTGGAGYAGAGAGAAAAAAASTATRDTRTSTTDETTRSTTGPHSSNVANQADPRVDSDRDGRGVAQKAAQTASGNNTTSSHANSAGHNTSAGTGTAAGLSSAGSAGLGHGGHDTMGSITSNKSSTTGTSHKPSLLDRLNPMKDSDGDGKKGFMK